MEESRIKSQTSVKCTASQAQLCLPCRIQPSQDLWGHLACEGAQWEGGGGGVVHPSRYYVTAAEGQGNKVDYFELHLGAPVTVLRNYLSARASFGLDGNCFHP